MPDANLETLTLDAPRRKTRSPGDRAKTILLVDDDSAIRRMLFRILTAEDYIVLTASNGVEAVDLANAANPDLVLLDLNLPIRSGWDTFERLTSENPLLSIVIITAQPNQLFPALASGVGALFEKPLDMNKLLITIRELLAEPVETRLGRMAGRAAQFHYLPSKQL